MLMKLTPVLLKSLHINKCFLAWQLHPPWIEKKEGVSGGSKNWLLWTLLHPQLPPDH